MTYLAFQQVDYEGFPSPLVQPRGAVTPTYLQSKLTFNLDDYGYGVRSFILVLKAHNHRKAGMSK